MCAERVGTRRREELLPLSRRAAPLPGVAQDGLIVHAPHLTDLAAVEDQGFPDRIVGQAGVGAGRGSDVGDDFCPGLAIPLPQIIERLLVHVYSAEDVGLPGGRVVRQGVIRPRQRRIAGGRAILARIRCRIDLPNLPAALPSGTYASASVGIVYRTGYQLETRIGIVWHKRGVHARRWNVALGPVQAQSPGSTSGIPLPEVVHAAPSADIPTAEHDELLAAGSECCRVSIARRWFGSWGGSLSPGASSGIPLPGVLGGIAVDPGSVFLHAAEEHGLVAGGVPGQSEIMSRRWTGGWFELGPGAGLRIPLPGVTKRNRDACSIGVGGVTASSSEEQGLPG